MLEKYQGKNLNSIRKIFREIFNKMVDNFFLKENKNEDKISNCLNFFFNYPNKELMIIIENFLKEFKRKNSFLIFSFDNFKKVFDLTLNQIYKQKLRKFFIQLEYFCKIENVGENIDYFQNAIFELSVFSNCVRYLKEIYEYRL